ncbi:MAG: DUF1796 family putative cysteine peptidase [Hyphomonadaceae bacterium]
MPRQYDQVVSLGRGCQPAHQIRRLHPDAQAHVFDWIITPDDCLAQLIDTELDGFFSRERLIMGPEDCIVDRATDARFLHEFPEGADFATQHAKHVGRYEMLADRWRSLLSSEKRILFVRQHAWNPDLRATAVRLRDAIAAKAPRLAFSLLYLTANQDDAWDEDGIANVFLRQPEPYVWTGDDVAWEQILRDAPARFEAR